MLRERLRRVRRYVDNPEVAQLRSLMRAYARAPRPAVVQLGASESLFVGPQDADRRTLSELLAVRLGPDRPLHAVAGGGYPPALFEGILRHLSRFDSRPVVAMALVIRIGQPPWALHPHYSFARAVGWIQGSSVRRPWWTYRARLPVFDEAAMARLETRPFRTLDGTYTIGEYRRSLRDPQRFGLTPQQATHRLFAFNHGSLDPPMNTWLDAVNRLGGMARSLGFPMVTYEPPIPYERISEVLGQEATTLNRRWVDMTRAAFVDGYGSDCTVETAFLVPSKGFIDPDDATEHVNEHGRRAMVEVIAPALERQLRVAGG